MSYPLWAGFRGVKWVAVITGNTGSVLLFPHASKFKTCELHASKNILQSWVQNNEGRANMPDTWFSAPPPCCRNSLWLLSTSADAISPCFKGCSGASREKGKLIKTLKILTLNGQKKLKTIKKLQPSTRWLQNVTLQWRFNEDFDSNLMFTLSALASWLASTRSSLTQQAS